jgi:hypothetical protein
VVCQLTRAEQGMAMQWCSRSGTSATNVMYVAYVSLYITCTESASFRYQSRHSETVRWSRIPNLLLSVAGDTPG